jgi:hypothetical protein
MTGTGTGPRAKVSYSSGSGSSSFWVKKIRFWQFLFQFHNAGSEAGRNIRTSDLIMYI